MWDKYFVNSLWKYKVLNNTLEDYFLAMMTLLFIFFVCELFHKLVIGRAGKIAAKTKNKLDDFIVNLIKKVGPTTYMWISTWTALQMLTLSKQALRITGLIMIIWMVMIIINVVEKIVTYVISRHLDKDSQAKSFITFISFMTKAILWIFGAFMIVGMSGLNLTSAMTGLGISSIIVAFALQNVLADLFSSFSIYLDKPFKVGDYISSGTEAGFVKKIGIKTTRIEGPTGQMIIVANKDLVNARIQNFYKLNERQVKLQLRLELTTSSAKVLSALEIIKAVVSETPNTELIRANLFSITENSLLLESLYAIKGVDYNKYLDIQQAILIEIKNRFEKHQIEMALPMQKIVLDK